MKDNLHQKEELYDMYKKKYELTYQDLINQVRKYDKLTVEKKQYEEQTKT